MIEFVVGVVLAAGAVWFVLLPVFRPHGGQGMGDGGGVEEDFEDDMSARAVALRALREIEFDRATGKLSDADYDALRAKYTTEAVAALRAEEKGRGTGDAGRVAPAAKTRPSSPVPRLTCPTHGARPEPDAAFCSECGRRLGKAPGYCARCGTALEGDARFCHACGTRVAA